MTSTLEAPGALTQDVRQADAGVTTWVFDPSHTLIEFSAKHMMFTTVKGRFAQFTGELRVNEQHPQNSSVELEIEAASLDTRTEMRDNHLRSADFLHVAEYPTITFTSTRVELPVGARVEPGLEFTLVGDLTIRGVTREVKLQAEYQGQDKGPYGNQIRAFTARTKINREDWGLTWNVAIESGGVLVGKEIKIEIEAQLNPKKEG